MGRLVRGATSGLIATIAMTGVMFAGKALGLLVTPPPKEITARAGEQTGVTPRHLSRDGFGAAWLGAHLCFGMSCGVGYVLARRLLPGKVLLPGMLYGIAIWCISYLGVMPELGLYPWPSEDSDSRKSVMIVAHAVYGVTVAASAREAKRP